VLLFLSSMLGLVLSGRLTILLLSWDLLGFSSLFLVFYYRSRASLVGGILTGSINRLGDCSFLILFGVGSCSGNSFCFSSFCLLILIAITKSAQVPFSSWLPAAIVAPTPVSALVHSSTLVTAGVYLLYRFLPCSSLALFYFGIFTILTGGIRALLETDVKRVIAYSTLSQLGLIILSLGLNFRGLCFLHLILHAIFKALLFMSVGVLIHSCFGSQESRSFSHFPTSTV
jgi:NADH-ubiquinone oxidoreductase chain 5